MALLGLLLAPFPALAEVTDADLAREAGAEWLHVNGDWAGRRYSTLKAVNAGNVKELKLAWTFETPVQGQHQATPIYHDGILYFTTFRQQIFAVDARTQQLVWRYEHQYDVDFGGPIHTFLGPVSRGVAISGNKVYFFSNDNKLIAFHYKTGRELWRVSVRKYIKIVSGVYRSGYWSSIAPLAIPGKIILGLNATDAGGLPGYLDALAAETGENLWSANMIPVGVEPGAETWPGDSAKRGGAGIWLTGSFDPELDLLFVGTANAYPWNPVDRSGDNVGAASIVAVHAATGKVAWRYQVVPGDQYDYDTASTPILISRNGRKTIVQPNKTGFMHHLDAETGAFINAYPFVNRITWTKGYDAAGRPMDMLEIPPAVRSYGSCGRSSMQPPEIGQYVELWPGIAGAVNIYPSAYHPGLGMVMIPATEWGHQYWHVKALPHGDSVTTGGACAYPRGSKETDLAITVENGEIAWRKGKSEKGYAGGMLATAGGLVFYGSADGLFNAVDAETGKRLWRYKVGHHFKSGPISYVLDGKQYIAQMTGGWQLGHRPNRDTGTLYVFSR